jgi:hypothetical protein
MGNLKNNWDCQLQYVVYLFNTSCNIVFYYFTLHFSHSFLNRISNLKPNTTYKMIKTQIVLHQALDYSRIYNFILDHDHKFKIIIVLKDV